MYQNKDKLVVIDADGTAIDAFSAISQAFASHSMAIGDLDRFQKRHNLFKYLGGAKEFPRILAKNIGKRGRKGVLNTLTDIYRDEARMYPGFPELIRDLIETPNIRVGIVTRNVTHEPAATLARLFARHGLDVRQLDFFHCLSLTENKASYFKNERDQRDINPARAYVCGDEYKDYLAALESGMHPFIASYGFESFKRLTGKFGIPAVLISLTPQSIDDRLRHALDLAPSVRKSSAGGQDNF